MIDDHGDRARYHQLADTLRHDIADGTYPPGARLPTESALRRRHDLGGMTVKRAMAVLRAEGLIVTRRGEPPLVRPAPPAKICRCTAGTAARHACRPVWNASTSASMPAFPCWR